MQTARYALPEQVELGWKDPVNHEVWQSKLGWREPLPRDMWQSVTLGGTYLLDEDSTPINVIIELKGTNDGYQVKNCRIVSDEVYQQEYLQPLEQWKELLAAYKAVYRR